MLLRLVEKHVQSNKITVHDVRQFNYVTPQTLVFNLHQKSVYVYEDIVLFSTTSISQITSLLLAHDVLAVLTSLRTYFE